MAISLTNTLTKKFVLISLLIGSFIIAYFFLGFLFTQHIKDEVVRINLAGNLRYRSYRMAWLAQMISEKTYAKGLPFTRRQLIKDLNNEILLFEKIAYDLEQGNVKIGIKPIRHYRDALKEFNAAMNEWNREMKPALKGFLRLSPDASEKQVRASMTTYDTRLNPFVNRVNRLMKSIERHYEREILWFDIMRLIGVGLLAGITLFIYIYMRSKVVAPLKRLRDAAKNIENGDFDINVAVTNRDDIGRLSIAFNSMSKRIGELFDEKGKTLEDLALLNRVASASQSLSLDLMLKEFLEVLLSSEFLRIKKKGAIFLCDDENRTLKLASAFNFNEEQEKVCSRVSYGECMCGLVAEKGEAFVSGNIAEDKRHTKTYEGMKDHQHIILPLKSTDKMIGLLCMYLPPDGSISERTVNLLMSASDIISVSVQNAMNYRQSSMLAQSFDSSSDAIFITDFDGNITYLNPMAMWQIDYSKKEAVGLDFSMLVSPNNITGLYDEIFKKVLKNFWSGEINLRRKDGTEYPAFLTISPVRDLDGKVISFVSIARDITELKLAEAKLRKSEAGLANAQRMAHIGSWEWEIQKNRLNWSDEVYRIFGLESGDIMPTYEKFLGFLHPDDAEFVKVSVDNALSNIKPYSIDHRIILPDGSEKMVHQEAEVMVDDEGKPVRMTGTVQDITEYKRLEEQLRQSQKMEAIGTLTGGVAHDFNNILTAIIGYASVLQMKMKEDDPMRAYVTQVLAATERATNLTQSLLAFSRKQIINPVPLNLNDIVARVEKFLKRIIGEDIELHAAISEEDLIVYADSGQIEQVLMNLCTNARDAMPKGGVLTIRTCRVGLEEMSEKVRAAIPPEAISKKTRPTDAFAEISVRDTGTGIDEKTVDRIFEPFFTTKEVGKGTGLGLSMAYGIIKQHNGYIVVESEKDRGTVFRVYLPINEEDSRMSLEGDLKYATDTKSLPEGGKETLLVAEDDNDVRAFTCSVLREFGYKVIEAVNGEDAVAKFMENTGKVDLLLLDVVMPRKNGREAYEEIKKTSPDLKAVFLSGYTANIIHKQGILEKDMNFILKPVSPRDLLRRVREVLDTK